MEESKPLLPAAPDDPSFSLVEAAVQLHMCAVGSSDFFSYEKHEKLIDWVEDRITTYWREPIPSLGSKFDELVRELCKEAVIEARSSMRRMKNSVPDKIKWVPFEDPFKESER